MADDHRQPAPPDDPDLTREHSAHCDDATHIGPYHLLQKIGEGGMGEVWVADQREPIRRTVAVKVIRVGMDTQQVVARFDVERQALAVMDHPAIAKVLDAGATAQGRPYFVMEYVKGEPITTYCDRHRLSTADRLGLFIRVCEGVQHAHQKGIIHRDLKPSNVLVALQDGQPVPKIIDFGIAKATAHHLTEQTVFTELGVLIGTPEYMSPEQAEMTGLDIDTRTDVYALGAMLYELLTGTLPFEGKVLREKGLDEIRRVIRELDPPRPSTRVTQLGPASTEAAKNRLSEPSRLASQLRGDLDWITMKALEKDRTRRYETAMGLANDVRRHLEHEPVAAGPPSAAYRTRKFVRRHRFGVGAAAALVFLLMAFGVTMAVQARRIASERDRAERTSAFLVSLFEASDPDRSKGERLTARELLDTGVARLGRELENEPETRAALLHTIGRVYFQLGLQNAAERALEQALPFRRTLTGRARLDLAATLNELGKVYSRKGVYDRAEGAHREVLDIRRRVLGATHPDVGKSLHNLATVTDRRGRLAEAEVLYRQAVPLITGPDNPAGPAVTLLALGSLYGRQGKLSAGLDANREALGMLRRTLGVEHSLTLTAMNSVSHALFEAGEYGEAERLQRQTLATRRKLLGNTHFDVAVSLYNLGNTLDEEGRFEEAEATLRESLAIWRSTLPDPHVQTAFALNDLGIVLTDQGRCADAEPLYREALAMFQRSRGAPTNAAWSLHGLGDVSRCRGQLEQAEKHYRAALELRKGTPGAPNGNLADTEAALGRLLTERGRYEEAERLLRSALDARRQTLPATHWRIGYAQALLGNCLAGEHRFDEAEPLLIDGYEVLRTKRGEGRTETRDAALRIAALYDAWGRPEKAAEWQKKLRPSK